MRDAIEKRIRDQSAVVAEALMVSPDSEPESDAAD
jgi:hypothetical protein